MKKIILMFAILSLMTIALTGCLGAGTMFDEASDITNDTVDSMDALYVEVFNNQFRMYLNDNVRGTYVIGISELVSSVNEYEEEQKVTLVYKSLDGEKIKNFDDEATIDKNKRYKVEASKYDKNGLISEITVEELAE